MPSSNNKSKNVTNNTPANNVQTNNTSTNVIQNNNNIVPIVKIDTVNRNKKGKVQNIDVNIAKEEGQIPYMCIIS